MRLWQLHPGDCVTSLPIQSPPRKTIRTEVPIPMGPNSIPIAIANFARAQFGDMLANYDRVTAIRDWVNGHLNYAPRSTSHRATAYDVLVQRCGLCSEFLPPRDCLLSSCRSATRHVYGCCCKLEPPDFTASSKQFSMVAGIFSVRPDGTNRQTRPD